MFLTQSIHTWSKNKSLTKHIETPFHSTALLRRCVANFFIDAFSHSLEWEKSHLLEQEESLLIIFSHFQRARPRYYSSWPTMRECRKTSSAQVHRQLTSLFSNRQPWRAALDCDSHSQSPQSTALFPCAQSVVLNWERMPRVQLRFFSALCFLRREPAARTVRNYFITALGGHSQVHCTAFFRCGSRPITYGGRWMSRFNGTPISLGNGLVHARALRNPATPSGWHSRPKHMLSRIFSW